MAAGEHQDSQCVIVTAELPGLEVIFTSQEGVHGHVEAERMASFLQRYSARARWPVGVRVMTSSTLPDGKAEVVK